MGNATIGFPKGKTTTKKADLEIGDSSACINGQNRIDPMGKTTLEKFTPAGTSRTNSVGQNHNDKSRFGNWLELNGQNHIDPMGKTTLEKFTPAGTSRTK